MLVLVAAAGPEMTTQRWDAGVIPIWALHQDAPATTVRNPGASLLSPGSSDCPPIVDFFVTNDHLGIHYDEQRSVTEIYTLDPSISGVIRHNLDSMLNRTPDTIFVNMGIVWIAEDLDSDGNVELVTQYADALRIYSAPDWTLRAEFFWPGMNVVMYAGVVGLDADSDLEVYATPNSLGGTGRAVIIDYDSLTGTFVKIADISTPNGAAGQSAVGDFDEDGRVEFIWGNNTFGYELYEWQGTVLSHIGLVGDSIDAMAYSAVACRPKPGGSLFALLGYSGSDLPWSYAYYLLRAIGDNLFEIDHVFAESTPYMGIHPSQAGDVDCDALDELVMTFNPAFRAWGWSEEQSDFVEVCTWDRATFGTLSDWYVLDLDRNSSPEWGAVSHLR
ncbi:MAG TPA: hypothetical protein VM118_06190 [Acidobacteriota bacterium]|nr:hypothetical protein [Acidobacteriota bacterium]